MAIWSGLGITLGYEPGVSYTDSVEHDLDYLKAIGFTKIRLVGNTIDATMPFMRTNAILAKQKGFYVIYGCSANGVTLTSTNFATYQTAVLAEAAIAEQYGFDEFVEGNEEELRIDGTSIADCRALILARLDPLSTAIRAVYSGLISYNMSQGAETWILTKDANDILPGATGTYHWDIDKIGANVYGNMAGNTCTRSSFQSRINAFKNDSHWGSRYYISEWNTNYNTTKWAAEAAKPEIMAAEVANRLKIIQDEGVSSAYYFCWGNSQEDYFAVNRGDNSLGLWFNPLSTNNKRWWFI